MYYAFLAVVSILFLLIALRDLRLGVFLILATLPTYLLRFEILGVPSTLLEVNLLLLIVVWLIRNVGGHTELAWLKPWRIPMILLALAATIGVFVAPDRNAALGVWKAYFIEPMAFFVVMRTTLKDYDDGERSLMALGASALIVSAFALFQKVTGLGIPIPWDVEGRVTSVFPYPNALGLFVGPIVVLSVGALFRSIEARFHFRSWFWFLLIVLGSAAILFSQTEAAWIAIPASLAIGALFLPRWRFIAAPIVVAGLLIVLFVPAVRSKVLLQDYSGEVRQKQWNETVAMLSDHPLFGAGLSGYPTALAPYHTHPEIEIFQYPHDIILNIWSELGLLGLLSCAWLCVRVFVEARRSAVVVRSRAFWLTFACGCALLEMTIHGLVDVPYFKNDLALLTWAILALLSWSYAPLYAPSSPTQHEDRR